MLTTLNVWLDEAKYALRDEGMLIFLVFVPLIYPLFYSWIYNNEVATDVPVVVVDKSNTDESREIARLLDATEEVEIIGKTTSLEEAKHYVMEQKAYGVVLFPEDFALKISRGEQSPLPVYSDMSLMLTYKAVYTAATSVVTAVNSKIQMRSLGNFTDREDELATEPFLTESVPIFNNTGGYGNFVLPAILILVLQQTLVLGVGLGSGTAREKRHYARLSGNKRRYGGTLSLLFGKALCFFMIYMAVSAYVLLAVPRFFSFVSLIGAVDLIGLLVPYLLACVFCSIVFSAFVSERENIMLLAVALSPVLLFLSGVSWPESNMPPFWQGVSWVVPSTFGIQGFVALNSMGAHIDDIWPQILCLWVQAAVYCLLSAVVLWRQRRQQRLFELTLWRRKKAETTK